MLYADDLVLMSETIEGLRNTFLKRKDAFENMGLKVNLGKTRMMVSGVITKGGLSKSKVDPCGVYILRVKLNSFYVYNMVSGSMADVLEWKRWAQCFQDVRGMLERQWSRKRSNVMKLNQ